MKISSSSIKLIKTLAVLTVLALISYILYDNYNNIRNYQFKIEIQYLILSFILLLIGLVCVPIIWYLITQSFGCNLSVKDSIVIRLKSEIGKYLPGRVLGYGYLLIHYDSAGIEKKRVFNSSFYELLLTTVSSFVFFTLTMYFQSYEYLSDYKYIFIIISLLSVIAIHPSILQKITNSVFKILKKETLDCKFDYLKSIEFLFLYLFVWFIFGAAFFFFIRAFSPVHFDKIIYISGVFAVSTFAGFMVFFLPAGIGAREGMLIFLLTSILGTVPTIIVAIGSRIWMILGDIVLFLVAIILSRLKDIGPINKYFWEHNKNELS